MNSLILVVIGIVIGWFTAQFEFSKKAMVKIQELWVWLKAKIFSTEPPAPSV